MPNRGTGVYLHPSTRLFSSAPSGSGTPGGPRSASGRPFMAGRERRQFQGEWPLHYGRAIEKNPGNLTPIVSSYSCGHFLGACGRSVFCHVKMFGCQDFRKSGCLESWMDSYGFVVGRHEARFQGLQDAPHVDPFIGLGSPVSASQRRHYVYIWLSCFGDIHSGKLYQPDRRCKGHLSKWFRNYKHNMT